MNFKFFFVKDFKEFLKSPKKILSLPQVKNNPELTKAVHLALSGQSDEAVYHLYKELIFMMARSFHANIDKLYKSRLFGDTGIDGLKIDFNFGLRLDIPQGNFHAKISDFDSGQIFFDEDISDTRLVSSDYYYIHWHIEIFLDGEKVFEHILNLKNQPTLIVFTSKAIGDTLALLPYAAKFQEIHGCKMSVYVREHLRDLTKKLYPQLKLVPEITLDYYATFFCNSVMGDLLTLPADPRTVSLTKLGGTILGLENVILPAPRCSKPKKRKIKTPYVCIAVQGSSTPKSWLYPGGWNVVIDYLKSLGYRVLCIDKNKSQTEFGYTVDMPENAEDFTGNIPLVERADMLYYAEFFIGLSSGLSWLANSVGCPVVMICGFSQDFYEFYTPYRVANRFVCNGCYNDITNPSYASNVCPHYLKTEREFECQKKISPRQVLNAIEKLIVDKNLIPPALK